MANTSIENFNRVRGNREGEKAKDAFAIDYSTLATYVDQISQPLISQAILESTAAKYMSLITGVKTIEQINILDINPYVVQVNNVANQGFIDSGTTIISAITASVCPLKIQNSFVLEGIGGLDQIWINQLIKAGSYLEDVPPFHVAFMKQLQGYTSQVVDQGTFMGGYVPSGAHSADTAGNTGFLGACKGILNQIFNTVSSGSVTTIAYSGAPTQATIFGIIESMVANIPVNMLGLDKMTIWCQPKYIDMYKRALMSLNNNTGNYWINPFADSAKSNTLEMTIPGRENITLRASIGLLGPKGSTNGYQGFILSNDENFTLVTDLLNDYERTVLWFSNDFDQMRATTKLKIAGICRIDSQVVVY